MSYIFGKDELVLDCSGPRVPATYGTGWTLMREPKPADGKWTAQANGTWKDITDYGAVRRAEAKEAIRETFTKASTAPVTITVPEGTFTFNGGQDSANAIAGAVSLAQDLKESNLLITDIDNKAIRLQVGSAITVVTQIRLAYRKAFLKKQEDIFKLH